MFAIVQQGRLELSVLAALALFLGGCASSGSTPPVPHPFPLPRGEGARPPDATSAAPIETQRPEVAALITTALSLRGTRYRDGGSDVNGFDCSGFTQYVFARHGVRLPRAVKQQYKLGRTVARKDVARGDLVFFSTTAPGASHVAIALGPDEFVHAPSTQGVVRVERISARYWSARLIGIRRLPLG